MSMSKTNKIVLSLLIFVALVAVTTASLFYFRKISSPGTLSGANEDKTETPGYDPGKTGEEEEKTPRYLDGILVVENDKAGRPLAVVIDNKIESLPPSGLVQASLIYEFPVEAGITRLLALFAPEVAPEEIGPVRSARPYEACLAEEYKALFVHAGGSPEVLEKINQGHYSLYNLDEIGFDGAYFWRGSGRRAPHNLYTSGENLRQALKDKEIPPKVYFTPWLFREDQNQEELGQEVDDVTIDFSDYYYKVRWVWHPETKNWWRYQRDLPYSDSKGEQIKAKNIIVQFCQMEVIDEIGRRRVDLESGGKALVFRNGQVFEATWQKNKKRTRFFDEQGEEITFNRGQTWIEIVPTQTHVLY